MFLYEYTFRVSAISGEHTSVDYIVIVMNECERDVSISECRVLTYCPPFSFQRNESASLDWIAFEISFILSAAFRSVCELTISSIFRTRQNGNGSFTVRSFSCSAECIEINWKEYKSQNELGL